MGGDGVLELVQGDDWRIAATCRKKNSGDPFDLTGATEISVKLKKSDGTYLTKLLSLTQIVITNAKFGKLEIVVPKVDSVLVKAGQLQSFDAVVTIAGVETTVRFINKLSVFARL